MKKISIFTASFGEGHNTAAKNVRDALLHLPGIEVEVCDLYQRTNPRLNRTLQIGYSVAINRFPSIWKSAFGILGIRGLLEKMLPTLAALREAMHSHIREFQPQVLVSTYPVFSFLVHQIRSESPFITAPLVTIVTDSTRINSVWYRCASDFFIVSDEPTRKVLVEGGTDPKRILVLGFPVSPKFTSCTPISIDHPGPPHKLLMLPSTRKRHTIRCISELMTIPGVELTILTGRNEELLKALTSAGFHHTPHVKLLGWTDQMPELLASHHLFIGKAGGAIVQEAIAARIPMVISHVVPGQEEGNIELVEELGIGVLSDGSATGLRSCVARCFEKGAAEWKKWKSNFTGISHPHASKHIAEFLQNL